MPSTPSPPFPNSIIFHFHSETMDQLRSQNIKSFTHYRIIKLTQLLLSLSLCSFLFSPSYLVALFHYFNFYFSTFPLQLFTHTVDKNCMFLLCNGLLVFVGITRSFSGSTGGDDRYEASSKYLDGDDGSESQFSDIEAKEPEMEKGDEERRGQLDDQQSISADQVIEVEEDIEMAIVEVEQEEEEEEQNGISQSVLEDEENGILYSGDEEEEEQGKESEVDGFLIAENLEEEEIIKEEEEENCLLSTEELNKKFDEFIRRMREDLRIEARQQQLIMV